MPTRLLRLSSIIDLNLGPATLADEACCGSVGPFAVVIDYDVSFPCHGCVCFHRPWLGRVRLEGGRSAARSERRSFRVR